MNQRVGTDSKLDGIVGIITAILIIFGIAANFYFSAQPIYLHLLGWVILAAIVAAITLRTNYGKKALAFLRDCRNELRKVTWPTRQETIQTTLVVVVVVIIFSLLLWFLDSILLWAVGFLTGQRG